MSIVVYITTSEGVDTLDFDASLAQIYETGLNFALGSEIQFVGVATLNGLAVTSPIILNKMGFYTLMVVGQDLRKIEFAVVDSEYLKVRAEINKERVGQSYFLRMARKSVRSYSMDGNSMSAGANIVRSVGFITNRAVGVTLQIYDKSVGAYKNIAKTMARAPGKFLIESNIAQRGVTDVKLKVLVAPSPYIVGVTGYDAWGDGDWGALDI